MNPLRTRFAALLVVLSLLALAPSPAQAGTETLKRSASNLLMWPLDLALSPVVAAKSIYTNLTEIDDSLAVRIFYPVPGFFWVTSVQAGAAVLRGVSGAIELVPGIALLPFDTELDTLFDPADRNDALVDVETPPLYLKFGIDYTSVPY